MPIAAPSEPVYYYEVSAGDYRLVYFIPPEELLRLRDADRINQAALVDFPDGVDLDCTAADFDEFERDYGYRPDCDPEAVGRTFFAMFSTPGYEAQRRTGFLAASDLEGRIDTVEAAVAAQSDDAAEPVVDAPTAQPAARGDAPVPSHAQQQARLRHTLEALSLDGIDPRKSLPEQDLTKIAWSDGDPAEDAFVRLHRKQRGAP